MIQVGIGIVLGFTIEFNVHILSMILPSLLIFMYLILVNLFMTYVISKLFHWDLITAWLACCPGLMQNMVIIAHDLQADTMKVLVAHTARIIIVILVTPLVLLFVHAV